MAIKSSSKQKLYHPIKLYDIKLKIKDLDFSNALSSVQIVSSITNPYQTIILKLYLDPYDVIQESIYGQDPLFLSIILYAEDSIMEKQIDLELMHIKTTDIYTTLRANNYDKLQREMSLYTFICLCRKPFITMTYNVNEIYESKTLKQIIQNLVSKTNGQLIYDNDNENKDIIPQVIISPSSVYKSIKYLDFEFGLFNGIGATYCNYDNRVYIKNLTKKMDKDQTFTIYQLSLDNKDNNKIMENCNDGKSFYTYSPIQSSYDPNTKYCLLAKDIKHITKPKDNLYYTISQTLDDVCKDYGLTYKNKKVHVDYDAVNKIKYYIDSPGFDKNEYFANSKIAKAVGTMTEVNIQLERNLRFLNLLNVGESVKVNPSTVEFSNLSGKYILKSSIVSFERMPSIWSSTASINLVRTNKTI